MKEQILSVGIDIGTSTTQLVFSKLYIENRASVAS
ncbi:ethanolamine ammonia-lyase reactivating factor EutA, partial [Halanaerobium congolense]